MTANRLRRTLGATAVAALLLSHVGTAAATPTPRHEVGGGWDEVVCAGCVAAGTMMLLSGASGFTLLVNNPSVIPAILQVCLKACRSAIEELAA
jgi:hypothetical protein